MTDLTIRFSITDLNDELPAEGYHPAVVASARMRTSQNPEVKRAIAAGHGSL
jgi:hypothetical protein